MCRIFSEKTKKNLFYRFKVIKKQFGQSVIRQTLGYGPSKNAKIANLKVYHLIQTTTVVYN